MTREEFAAAFDVPRETLAKFDRYADLLVEWQARMNLVGPATLGDIWGRHFADSAQLLPLADGVPGPWLDIGSGAGFPALVVALLGRRDVHLVDSTAKKCRFLETVAAELGLDVTIHNARIESMPAFAAGIISARAAAPLERLFDWGLRFARPATRWILPKGAGVEEELSAARARFAFDATLAASITDPRAQIVVARGVRRR